jgi:hypothetical protein
VREQGGDEAQVGDGELDPVQDDDRAGAGGQRPGEDSSAVGAYRGAQRAGERAGQVVWIGRIDRAADGHEPAGLGGGVQRKRGLADPARAGDRDQARLGQQGRQALPLCRTSDEDGARRRGGLGEGLEAVARAHGVEVVGGRGVALELLAQREHGLLDRAGADAGRIAERLAQDVGPRDRLARASREVGHQLQLAGGEQRASRPDLARLQVDGAGEELQSSHGQPRSYPRPCPVARGRHVTDGRGSPRSPRR